MPHINGTLYIEQQGTADPTVLVLIAFTIALAIVLRYANALQEDSGYNRALFCPCPSNGLHRNRR